jgi:hypothetical protein
MCARVLFSALLIAVITTYCAAAPRHTWRLSRAEAIAIAERAAVAHGFKLRDYPERTVQQFTRTTPQWFVGFAPPSPRAADTDFLVIVDDATGKAELVQGQ